LFIAPFIINTVGSVSDGRRVSVINAPAGAGKTRILAEIANAWTAAGRGPVIGITPSQSARNTLAAGVAESCNSAQFLGHLPGKRSARSPVPTGQVTIADAVTASVGDLIVCPQNDRKVEAGEPGRTLANGDLLRIEAITPGGLLVRRALDADQETGQRRWTDRQFLYADCEDAELGYAVTDHAAQDRTVQALPGNGPAAVTASRHVSGAGQSPRLP
jgi:AAA domain